MRTDPRPTIADRVRALALLLVLAPLFIVFASLLGVLACIVRIDRAWTRAQLRRRVDPALLRIYAESSAPPPDRHAPAARSIWEGYGEP